MLIDLKDPKVIVLKEEMATDKTDHKDVKAKSQGLKSQKDRKKVEINLSNSRVMKECNSSLNSISQKPLKSRN